MKKLLLAATILSLSLTAKAQNKLVINEIMAANVDYVLDPSFNYGSWIELYNPSSSQYDTSSLYVTDDINDLKKQRIRESAKIAKGGFYTVWFDHYDGVFAPNQMDFKLDYDGGSIYVTDGTSVICSLTYPKAIGRVSYARTTDGGDTWAWTASPTPGATNSASTFVGSADKQLSAPEFSVQGGLFTDAFDLKITSAEGADIYYTTSDDWGWDASTPDINDSYNTMHLGTDGTIGVSGKSVVIRARAYKEGYLPSEVTTRSYIYKDKDYVFPIISVATSSTNLYSNDYGIFEGGSDWYWDGYEFCPNGRPGNGKSYKCNWNMDWDRPVNFEYITADGEYALNQEVDMSMCGGWSRAWTPHSFKLKAGKYYMGKNTMDYQFFDSKPNLKHKVLQIRNGGNDNTCRIKDAALQEIVRRSGLRVNTQAWQPVHVFINGAYYDVLNMREPNNKHYAYSNYGYDTDSIDQFEISPDSGYVQKVGTAEKFDEWFDLSSRAASEETYDSICSLVDIEEYINYMAVELYCCCNDWVRNNVKAFRLRRDGKFHFVLFDMDSAGETSSPFTTLASRQTLTYDKLYGIDGVTPWKTGDKITQKNEFACIFVNMLSNETFRRRFIDTFCVIAGSTFDPDYVAGVVNEMSAYMNKGMQLNGGSCSSSASNVKSLLSSTHQNSMITQLKSYTPFNLKGTGTFTLKLLCDLDEGELFINDIKVPTGSFYGKVYKPVKVRAAAPAGYKFAGWYKTVGGKLYSTDPEIEITEFSPRYKAKWEKMTDEEMIAEGLNPSPVVINEVSASNTVYVNELFKKADWIELYNTSDSVVNIAGLYLTDNLNKPQKYQIPTDNVNLNTIIPAHGYKVVWCDKKDGVGSAIHAGFKLEADSGQVALFQYNGDEVVCSDTVRYEYHDGTQSFGRYPDGGAFGYLMPKSTPGASNTCKTDVMDFLAEQRIVIDGIEDVKVAQTEGCISIAYVGNGIVNVKSENGNVNFVQVVSSLGATVYEEAVNKPFVTIDLSALPRSLYIIKAKNSSGDSNAVKFNK